MQVRRPSGPIDLTGLLDIHGRAYASTGRAHPTAAPVPYPCRVFRMRSNPESTLVTGGASTGEIGAQKLRSVQPWTQTS